MLSAPLILTATLLFGMKRWNKWNAHLYAFSSMWLVMLIYLCMMTVILWAIYGFGIMTGLATPMLVIWFFLMIVIYGTVFAGIHRAAHPKLREVKIPSKELSSLWEGKTIALISDVHIGLVRQKNFVKKIVSDINSIKPDIVFIAGDLADGPDFPYEEFLSPLADLVPPLGTYYVPGNHEQYLHMEEKFYNALPENITVLRDEMAIVNNTEIIGIDFRNEKPSDTKNRLLTSGYSGTYPSIVLLHDPKNTNALVEANVNLVLSGHTHGGQFFPNTLIVKGLYGHLNHGLNKVKNTWSYVSVGAGTALSPVRIGTTPEIAVLSIVQE
jgi:uncharacterized protein